MKTSAWLIEYAKAQVGKPYWYGSYGQTATEALYNSLKKQYPSYYTATDFASQYGQKVHDCSGIIKGALWCDTVDGAPTYNSAQDINASMMYSKATKKGKIADFTKTDGALVFRGETESGIHHVGVYADGYVYEAKGHAYGVQQTTYKASDWNFWGQHPDFEYDIATPESASTPASESADTSTASKSTSTTKLTVDGEIGKKTVTRLQEVLGQTGSNVDGFIDGQPSASKKYWTSIISEACKWTGGASACVKKLQQLVKGAGYTLTVDGELGTKTAKAVQSYLIAKGYSCGSTGADGYFGANSAKALQNWLNAQ